MPVITRKTAELQAIIEQMKHKRANNEYAPWQPTQLSQYTPIQPHMIPPPYVMGPPQTAYAAPPVPPYIEDHHHLLCSNRSSNRFNRRTIKITEVEDVDKEEDTEAEAVNKINSMASMERHLLQQCHSYRVPFRLYPHNNTNRAISEGRSNTSQIGTCTTHMDGTWWTIIPT